jgi:Fibronectin type III domain
MVPDSSPLAIPASHAADLGRCLSAPGPACFTGVQSQFAAAIAEPVTGPPINLTAVVNGTTVTLTWTPPSLQDAPIISYIIDVGSTPNFVTPDLVSLDTFSSSTTLQAAGVAAGNYYVRVRARNAFGNSAPSNEIQVVVGVVIVPGPGCPSAPRSLTGAGSVGTVTMSWQPPLSGAVQSYLIEAGSAPGAANLASLNNGLSTTFIRGGVPAGTFYVRVRALAAGCAPSAPSNELIITVTGGSSGGNPFVTLSLVYSCSACTGDPDNYALNVDCVSGRCTVVRTSNATRSGTVSATVRGPGVHNVEVVARLASWTLTIGTSPPGSGGMVPGSWNILYPPGGAGLTVQPCRMTSSQPEMFAEFTVGGAGSGSC